MKKCELCNQKVEDLESHVKEHVREAEMEVAEVESDLMEAQAYLEEIQFLRILWERSRIKNHE